MRCEPPHQMQRCWIELLFNGCKWVFLHCDAWHPIFPHRRKHMDSIQSLPCCFIYTIVSCLFFPSTRSTCLAHFDSVEIKKTLRLQATEMTTLCKLFHTHCFGLQRYVLSMKQERLPFPLSPLGYIQMGRIFFFFFCFFATRHKVIKSWKQTLKEALSKKEKLLW